MVAPIVIAAVAAAGAIAQWMNSEAARKASAKERKRMEEMFDKIQDPEFDMSNITPEDFKVVGKYVPQAAAYVAEKNPTLIEESGDMRLGRSAQLEALRGLRRAATEERDPALMAQLDLASSRGQSDAQSRQASILQDASRRGQGSSLNTLMAQMQGAATAQNRSAEESRLNAIDSYKNKLAALRDSASLGGDIRGQDIDMQQTNMNAINSFNQRTAAGRQNYLNDVSRIQNEGQRYNVGVAQGISDKNVDQRNQAAESNLARLNALKQQRYGNAVNKAGIAAGQINTGIQYDQQAAADRNKTIQGVTDAGISYAGSREDAANREEIRAEERRQRKLDRAAYGRG